jgi:hypothetical protein
MSIHIRFFLFINSLFFLNIFHASTKGEIISLSEIYPLEKLYSPDCEFGHLQFIGQTVFAFGEKACIYGLAVHDDTYIRRSYFWTTHISGIIAASKVDNNILSMSNGMEAFSLIFHYDNDLKRFDPYSWSEVSDSMISIQDEERDYTNIYKNNCYSYSEKQKKIFIGEIVYFFCQNYWLSKERRSQKPQFIIDLSVLLKDEERLKLSGLKAYDYKIRCNNERCFFILEHFQKQDIGIDDTIWAVNYKSDTTKKYPFYTLETGNAIIDFAFNDKRLIIFDAQGMLYLLSLKKKVARLISSIKVLKDSVSIQSASISISEEDRIGLCITIKEQKERLFFLYQYLREKRAEPVIEDAIVVLNNTFEKPGEASMQGSDRGQSSTDNRENAEKDYLEKSIGPQQETEINLSNLQTSSRTSIKGESFSNQKGAIANQETGTIDQKKVKLIKKKSWDIITMSLVGFLIFITITFLAYKWNQYRSLNFS